MKNIVVVGASGGIGQEFVNQIVERPDVQIIHACARSELRFNNSKIKTYYCDYANEQSVAQIFNEIDVPLDMVIVATGLLHNLDLQPEKTIKSLDLSNSQDIYLVNVIGPSLVMKYALPKMNRNEKSVFAALSARVGSISDNRLGGWYTYRASKSALNMVIKSASIEMARTHPEMAIIGLHPGTVDTELSKPFQGFVQSHKLFTSNDSVRRMLEVIDKCTSNQSGRIFDYSGHEIQP
jgi:NAD(P)-dependent dehydrogenase (short-subunit alcohol dehydrogenase family)